MPKLKKRLEKVLFLTYFESSSVPSIEEGINFVSDFSQFPIHVLNLADCRIDGGFLKIPPTVDLNIFSAILIHNTVAYSVENLRSLDELTNVKFCDFDGVKIVMKQDEHYRFNEFSSYVMDVGIDYIFSVMPEGEIKNTYGLYCPGVQILPMLTGYVTPSMRARELKSTHRSIDVGYRGSIMPLSFGRLCYQKRKIGDEVAKRLSDKDFKLDISSRWEDRIGGNAWFDFLSSCKCVLGVESGTGLFDLDGRLEDKCRKIEEKLGPNDDSDDYAEKYLAELKDIDGLIKYHTISPRHFEAIACGAVQILMPGKYSGKMISGRHYVELAEDYSNLEEVIAFVSDKSRCESMAALAFSEVLLDEKNWIESFVESIDEVISSGLSKKNKITLPIFSGQLEAKNALIFQAHNYGCDPRRDTWYSCGAPEGILFNQLGISDVDANELLIYGDRGEAIINVPRMKWDDNAMESYVALCAEDIAASNALRELFFISHVAKLTDKQLSEIYNIPTTPPYLSNFRWILGYVLDSAYTLVEAAFRLRGLHAIVAVNFPSLPAALILKSLLGVPVVYEALEYWPEANIEQSKGEEIFWREFERRIVGFSDFRGTVTPGLAQVMKDKFGVDFYSVPNSVPLSDVPSDLVGQIGDKGAESFQKKRFLYQGSFAPGRCIDKLINAWKKADERAILFLRGPDSPYKDEMIELVKKLGLNDRGARVIFLDSVSPSQLIIAAFKDADVALIPYMPICLNYANCSPNKLGQYLAAGLPILANSTNFVAEIIDRAKCGETINFSEEQELIASIKRFCDGDSNKTYSKNAFKFFNSEFNWESVSKPFYDAVTICVKNVDDEILIFNPPRVFNPPRDVNASFSDLLIQNSLNSKRSIGWRILRRLWRLLPIYLREKLRPVLSFFKKKLF